MDGFPSGQRGQTVNLLRLASVVRIHLHPFGFVPVMSNHDAGVAELADAQVLLGADYADFAERIRKIRIIREIRA